MASVGGWRSMSLERAVLLGGVLTLDLTVNERTPGVAVESQR